MAKRRTFRGLSSTRTVPQQLTLNLLDTRRVRRPPQLSLAMPPVQPPRVAVAGSPRKPTLTEIFNRAARNYHHREIATKRQIELLKRQMSQARHTYEMTPLGSVTRSCNPNRDRQLQRRIDALQTRLDRHQGLKKTFSKACRQVSRKQQFNRSGFSR